MAFNSKPKKPHAITCQSKSSLCTTLFFVVLFTIPALFLLRAPTTSICTTFIANHASKPWSGDLRNADFAWNRLVFIEKKTPPVKLKIAVFSRKWPIGTTPGGMERHAYTLHTALAQRGHQVHIFTSPVDGDNPSVSHGGAISNPQIHFHEGEPGRWRYNKAWEQFDKENQRERPFDVVHSESVALPHWLARNVQNLAVSWHGIALESLQSSIYQDLTRKPNEPISPDFNRSLHGVVPKVLNEIRFFKNYEHHVAISDSCGEMLRDVYQIPSRRVHVIVNGVDENGFGVDVRLGIEFRSKIGVPINASLVLGVAGRLVKDKGHPLLYEAFSELMTKYPDVYLIVAGSGPWQQRYKELGSRVLVLGLKGWILHSWRQNMSGKPVMASRFPSIKGTIVVEDEFGFMFSPNTAALLEALEAAVMEGSRRLAQRGKACQQYAASMFTASKMALAYERLFLCIKNETFCTYH
uniref:Glycosyltransferase subfamily 4-like N-terminal domain-containing protein n=1 Tax=Salix viminalis TaxID=40686 RepID=A0A6N2K110_SALVM